MCAACHTNAERGFSQAQIKKVKEYLSSSHGLAITKSACSSPPPASTAMELTPSNKRHLLPRE